MKLVLISVLPFVLELAYARPARKGAAAPLEERTSRESIKSPFWSTENDIFSTELTADLGAGSAESFLDIDNESFAQAQAFFTENDAFTTALKPGLSPEDDLVNIFTAFEDSTTAPVIEKLLSGQPTEASIPPEFGIDFFTSDVQANENAKPDLFADWAPPGPEFFALFDQEGLPTSIDFKDSSEFALDLPPFVTSTVEDYNLFAAAVPQ
jgi:hypothetical protein